MDYGMRVWMNPQRMTALDVTAQDVADAINGQNILATAGELGAPPFGEAPQFQYTLQAKGRLTSVEEFGDIIIRAIKRQELLAGVTTPPLSHATRMSCYRANAESPWSHSRER